jgi:hypothetical protein
MGCIRWRATHHGIPGSRGWLFGANGPAFAMNLVADLRRVGFDRP